MVGGVALGATIFGCERDTIPQSIVGIGFTFSVRRGPFQKLAIVIVKVIPTPRLCGHGGAQAAVVVGVIKTGKDRSICRFVYQIQNIAIGIKTVACHSAVAQSFGLNTPVQIVNIRNLVDAVGIDNGRQATIGIVIVIQLVTGIICDRSSTTAGAIGESQPMTIGGSEPCEPIRGLVKRVSRGACGIDR